MTDLDSKIAARLKGLAVDRRAFRTGADVARFYGEILDTTIRAIVEARAEGEPTLANDETFAARVLQAVIVAFETAENASGVTNTRALRIPIVWAIRSLTGRLEGFDAALRAVEASEEPSA